MEVTRTRERLPDEARSSNLSVLHDQLSVGLVVKGKPCNAGHQERVYDPQYDARDDGVQASSDEMLFHDGFLYTSRNAVMTTSMSLIPMKGTMMPPKP